LIALKYKAITLQPREVSAAVRLLGILQGRLEDGITNSIVDGEREPRERWLRPLIARDRRRWRAAEKLVKKLTGVKRSA
jgi:hypothetical protein